MVAFPRTQIPHAASIPAAVVVVAGAAERLLPKISVIAASSAICASVIEVARSSKSDTTADRIVQLTLQGTYLATRAALTEMLKRSPDLVVSEVNWHRFSTGTEVESHVTLIQTEAVSNVVVTSSTVAASGIPR